MPLKSKQKKHLAEANKQKRNLELQNELKEQERVKWQEKQQMHKSCMTFMATDRLQNIINHFSCPKCNQKGTQLVNQRSLKGFITNLEIICRCGSKFTNWTAADEFNEAVLMTTKLNGITKTQFQRFLLCLNFTAETETSGQSICLSSVAMQNKIRAINSKLIDLKEKVEKLELDRILEERPDVFIASEDGAYPNGVRTRNSGACFNTVMAYDKNNTAKIVGK